MILSSTEKKTRVFHNPIDLSACSSGGYAHKNCLDIAKCHGFVMHYKLDQFSMRGSFFHNLANIFMRSFNYTEKTNRNVVRID